MVTPASIGDWVLATAMGGALAAATFWFARALREPPAPDAVSPEGWDEPRELVGAASGDVGRR